MSELAYKYTFADDVCIEDAEASLLMAILTAEALHSPSQVRLDAAHAFDAERRMCAIAADTDVGADVNRLFVSFLNREFGPESFAVERVTKSAITPGPGAIA